MLTFLRRFFVQAPAIRELKERVYALEGDLEFLSLELKRVRGRVTGGVRSSRSEEPSDDIPAHIQGGQRMWLQRLDPISRRIHLQRLAGSDGVLRRSG